MKQLLIILSALLIAGCCSTKVIEKPIAITVPYEVVDTVKLIGDTIWYGGITNHGDTVGAIAVNPKSKTAVVDIKDEINHTDTVYYEVPTSYPVLLDSFLDRLLTTFFTAMPFWQKLILILLAAGLIYIVYSIKRKK